ncbi:unnamed protein product [Allacma fusca]|uniref:Uncharacterized protein n=1 Tax=Allacma fusca TaxID=39272 RepID=A0A8J2PCS5_9HEXA|nr:unnamed protein product [Allacma fusca]
MDIDSIFDDHNYAARRHGPMCTCTGNTTSDSDESDSEGEDNCGTFKNPSPCEASNQERGRFSSSSEQSKRPRHGVFCACDGLDSFVSCECSSEDEEMEGTSGAKNNANDSLSIAGKNDLKEIQSENSIEAPNVHQGLKLLTCCGSLKWNTSWTCHRCQNSTRQLIPYCTSCFKKVEGIDIGS